MKTLNIIFSLNFVERYVFKKSIEKYFNFKWQKGYGGFKKIFDSDQGYILNLTSTCLRITFFENTPESVVIKIEDNIFGLIKSKFNISDFLIEKITDNKLKIIEV
ncbi:hypothetical protein [Lysinibacillus xylanilyticus]|uniref:Uncharacterized protein n=1 Tax=Lysinibacillus xylanilyticus TaxID=582475 RepID=A0A2M9Q761_9BACI|nr:hypothetical protein [Lysinibacillus xylanilyticus]PJO43907.1 hypothetical protein CWD94_09960 [Lysinibacillus xylanilyticus]